MAGPRKWLGAMLLHAPEPLKSIRNAPFLGDFIHRLSYRALPENELVWARVKKGPGRGLWLELNPRTGQTTLRGGAEPAVQKSLAERLRPGMVFYDLGANIGYYSLLAARIVGSSGRVFCFEPDDLAAARLRRNILKNGFQNVTILESGVWSVSGSQKFAAPDASSPDRGTGRIVTGGEALAEKTITCVALDDFAAGAPPPHAIKCDVEGAEVEALRGAEKLLKTHRPWILCEIHSEANDRVFREFLSRFSYTFSAVDANHILALP